MAIRILLSFFFTLIAFFSIAQVLSDEQNVEEINRLYQEANKAKRKSPDSALILIVKMTELAKSVENELLLYKGHIVTGVIYQRLHDFHKADSIYAIMKNSKISEDDNPYIYYFYAGLGTYYQRQHKYDSAIVYYKKSLDILDTTKLDYVTSYVGIKTNLVLARKHNLEFVKAYQGLVDAERLVLKTKFTSIKKKNGLLETVYADFGILLRHMGDQDGAIEYFKKAAALDSLSSRDYYANFYNKTINEERRAPNDSTLVFLNRILEHKDDILKSTYFLSLVNRANFYISRNKFKAAYIDLDELKKNNFGKINQVEQLYYASLFDIAYKNKDFLSAKKFALLSDEILENDKPVLLSAKLSSLNRIIKAKLSAGSNHEDVLVDYMDFESVLDELQSLKLKQQTARWKIDYETNKKEAQIELLLKEREYEKRISKFQKWGVIGLLLGFMLLGIVSVLLFLLAKKRKLNNEIINDQYDILLLENNHLAEMLKSKDDLPLSILENEIILSNRHKTKLKLGDILYLESKDKAIFIYTKENVYKDWQTLKSYQSLLPDNFFIRVHRSFIANVSQIESQDNHSILFLGGKTIPRSKKI